MLDKKDIKYIIILAVLNCIFFYKVLLNPDGLFYPAMDLIRIYSPMEYFISNSIHSFHQLPLWNPYIFSGIPFVGNSINLMFYPFNFLFVIFGSDSMFGILTMLHVFMSGFFTYLFMRLIKAKRIPSLIAAIIFMFSGIFTQRLVLGMIGNGIVISFVPVVFFLAELLLQKRKIKFALFLGIALALQIIAGHAQNLLYASSALLVYLVIRMFFIYKEEKQLKSLINIVKYLTCAFIIGIALSSIYLLPTIETTTHITRSKATEYKFGSSTSLAPADLLTFISPDIYGTEIGYPKYNTYWKENYNVLYGYVGLFSLILALIALLFKRNKYTWAVFGVTLFTLLFALGKYTPFYYIVYNTIPLFKLFRGPAKMLFMYVFSMSVLAGIGSSFLFERIKKKQATILNWIKRLLIISLIFSTLILGMVLLNKGSFMNVGESMIRQQYEEGDKLHELDYYLNRVELMYNELIRDVVFVWFLLLFSILLLNYKIKNPRKTKLKYFMIALILLIILDLFFYCIPKIEYVKDSKEIFIKDDLIEFLEKDNTYFRIMDTTRGLDQELAVRHDIYKIGGYDVVILLDYNRFIDLLTEGNEELYIKHTLEFETLNASEIIRYNILNLLNVKYLLTEEKLKNDNLKLVHTGTVYINRLDINREVKIYENKEVLPRAFIVRNAKIIKEKEDIFDELKIVNPKKEIIIEKDFKDISKNNRGEFKEAKIVFYSPNKIIVNISLETPGFLVLSEKYYPGWKAFDNENKIEIMKTDYVLRSVYLEKGEHKVEFIYDPLSYKIGKVITILTILFIIIYFITFAQKNEKAR